MTRQDDGTGAAGTAQAPSDTAIAVDRLVTDGLKALADYEDLAQEQIDHIVKKASVAALDSTPGWPAWRSRRPAAGSSRTRQPRTCSRASTSRTAWAR